MRTITHTLTDCLFPANVHILPLADTHIGDAHCDMGLISDTIEKVLISPNYYTILDGDLMNTAIIGSKSDVYHDQMPPSEQLAKCADLFGGLAAAGKILAVLPGNHEERISRTVGVDMTQLLCRELGIEHLYSPTSALVFLRFGENRKKGRRYKIVYSIYCNHGRGGGRRLGGKLNALEDMARIVTADVYLMGHTHMPAVFRQAHYIATPQCTISEREQVFVNTASFLDWDGSYGDRQGYVPNSKKMPVIHLDPQFHHITVTI